MALVRPGLRLVGDQRGNRLFTMHGTIMLRLFARPGFAGSAGLADESVPLRIGAPDVAFPRPFPVA